jgi:hypothetical protein
VGSDTEWIEVDGAMLREQLRQAASDPEAIEILIEQRCYFPVRYVYKGAQYSAIVGAGAGKVMADHRPARADVPADKRVALGALAVLFVEALLLPGIVLKLAVIGITAVGLYPVLCRYVERHG